MEPFPSARSRADWEQRFLIRQLLFYFQLFFLLTDSSSGRTSAAPYPAASAVFPTFFALLRSARFFFVSSFFCST